MQILNDQQIEDADFVVTPVNDDRKNTDFSNLGALIKKGYEEGIKDSKEILDEFEKLFKMNLGADLHYYKNLKIENSGDLGLKLFDRLKDTDTVSNRELYWQLYLLNRENDYKNISFVVTDEGNLSSLKIDAEPNPVLKDVVVSGDSIFEPIEIREKFSGLIGKPYSPVKTLNAALNVLRSYKTAGYSLARIKSLKFNPADQKVYLSVSEV